MPGLRKISVRREKISKDNQDFIEQVLDRFGRHLRCLRSSCF